jgi:hypothetical protein
LVEEGGLKRMDQCFVVEEQELKERIVEVCLIKYQVNRLPDSDLYKLLDRYNTIRNRNNELRREEYDKWID